VWGCAVRLGNCYILKSYTTWLSLDFGKCGLLEALSGLKKKGIYSGILNFKPDNKEGIGFGLGMEYIIMKNLFEPSIPGEAEHPSLRKEP